MKRDEFLNLNPLTPLMKDIDRLFAKREVFITLLNRELPEALKARIYLYHPLPTDENEHVNHIQSESWHIVQYSKKMLALFEHYGIKPNEPDSFALLAMAIAEEHIPAFSVDKLENEKSRKNWNDFVYFLEIRWLMNKKRLLGPQRAIREWLELEGYKPQQIEDQVGSHNTKYHAVRTKHRILVDLRNSLNPKAKGQSPVYNTPPDEIPENILDEKLFNAFPEALERIRQVLKST